MSDVNTDTTAQPAAGADGGAARGGDVDTGQPVVKVDVAALDTETEKVVFDPLTTELGDIEEFKQDGFYKDLNAEHIRDMDPVARRFLHNFRVAAKNAETAANAKVTEAEGRAVTREKLLNDSEKALHRRIQEFNAIAKNPEVQKLLLAPEGELPDPLTPEGMEARVKKGVAEAMKKFLEPMAKAADAEQAQQRYMDFVESHPEMKETAFKADVVKLVRERMEAKAPIATEDAFLLVKANRIAAGERDRAQRVQAARAESMRRSQPAVASGSPGDATVPKDVIRRGASAIHSWLSQNPQARARYEREAGIR